jgi:hypothetical protein
MCVSASVTYGVDGTVPVARENPQPASGPRRLLDQVRDAVRARHYSRRTEKAYVAWIRRYILFHGKRHPAQMGAPELTRYLSWLAVERNISASTQNQALSALLFLYREVLEQEMIPATRFYVDRKTRQRRRHHLHESVVQRAVKEAVRAAGIPKRATCHTLRHSFAPHRPGAPRAPRRQHHHDLHPRPESRASRSPEPGRRSRPGPARMIRQWPSQCPLRIPGLRSKTREFYAQAQSPVSMGFGKSPRYFTGRIRLRRRARSAGLRCSRY